MKHRPAVAVAPRTAVTEINKRHVILDMLAARTGAVHEVLKKHIRVDTKGNTFVEYHRRTVLPIDEMFCLLGRLAKHSSAILDVKHEVVPLRNINDIDDFGPIEEAIPLLIPIANHLHQTFEIDFRS